MKNLIRQMLESAMFSDDALHKIVLTPEMGASGNSDLKASGSYLIPDDLFPGDCRVCRLPVGESFLQSLAEEIPTDRPVRVFICPPLLSRKELSDTLRAQYPLMDLSEIARRLI